MHLLEDYGPLTITRNSRKLQGSWFRWRLRSEQSCFCPSHEEQTPRQARRLGMGPPGPPVEGWLRGQRLCAAPLQEQREQRGKGLGAAGREQDGARPTTPGTRPPPQKPSLSDVNTKVTSSLEGRFLFSVAGVGSREQLFGVSPTPGCPPAQSILETAPSQEANTCSACLQILAVRSLAPARVRSSEKGGPPAGLWGTRNACRRDAALTTTSMLQGARRACGESALATGHPARVLTC